MGWLEDFGWSATFEEPLRAVQGDGLSAGRVVAQFQGLYRAMSDAGELLCDVSGRFRHNAPSPGAFPVVGDWVALRPRPDEGRGTIHAVLPRRSQFVRRASGDVTVEQVVAANVDTVFLLMGLDADFNPRRLERYLTLAHRSGAAAVVVLNKVDLCEDLPARLWDVASIAGEVPVVSVSARWGTGFDDVARFLHPGETIALLGSSGVGKSTLVNRLLREDRLRTNEVRSGDQRGRHTTTNRELVLLPDGVLVIDTPGMREIQLWEGEETLASAFDDLVSLAEGCRFRDCRHEQEPGCALRTAVQEGRLLADRLASYRKLQLEAEAGEAAREGRMRSLEKKRNERVMGRAIKSFYKKKG